MLAFIRAPVRCVRSIAFGFLALQSLADWHCGSQTGTERGAGLFVVQLAAAQPLPNPGIHS
jgi:hypothetical protein